MSRARVGGERAGGVVVVRAVKDGHQRATTLFPRRMPSARKSQREQSSSHQRENTCKNDANIETNTNKNNKKTKETTKQNSKKLQ